MEFDCRVIREAFAETGRAKGLPGNLVERLRNMLAYLAAIDDLEELKAPPNYGAHPLTGDRAGSWSLIVTKNWRMTFRIDQDDPRSRQQCFSA